MAIGVASLPASFCLPHCIQASSVDLRLNARGQVLPFPKESVDHDGAQEYAVFREDRHQVESITFGWCDQASAEEHIRAVLASQVVQMGRYELRIDRSDDHTCHLCR